MIKESYNYLAIGNKTMYYFESEGKLGTIPKAIIFTLSENNLWNLAFGDWHEGDIDDVIISNNYDIVKIIGTIAKVVYDFSAKYPTRHIYIQPVDEKRKKLYNHVFRRNYEDINTIFQIIGVVDGIDENYLPKKSYNKFKLIRKFVQ